MNWQREVVMARAAVHDVMRRFEESLFPPMALLTPSEASKGMQPRPLSEQLGTRRSR